MKRLFALALICGQILFLHATAANAQRPGSENVSNGNVRTWRSSDGKYTLLASLFNSTQTEARLLKPDGKMVWVQLSRLSENDRRFIEETDGTGSLPLSRSFGEPRSISEVALTPVVRQSPEVRFDPRPLSFNLDLINEANYSNNASVISVNFKKESISFDDLYQNATSDHAAIPFTRSNFSERSRPEVWIVDLKNRKSISTSVLPFRNLDILDISPDAQLIMTKASGKERRGNVRVDVWRVDGKQPAFVCGFIPYDQDGSLNENISDGFFVSNRKLVTTNHTGKGVLWEIPSGKALNTFDFGDCSDPAMTASRRYFGSKRGQYIFVFDLARFKYVAALQLQQSFRESPFAPDDFDEPVMIASLDFSPDGKHLAGSWYDALYVWECQTGKLVFCRTDLSRFGQHVRWMDNNYLMSEDLYLLDLKNQKFVWKYELGPKLRRFRNDHISFHGSVWAAPGKREPYAVLQSFSLPTEAERNVINKTIEDARVSGKPAQEPFGVSTLTREGQVEIQNSPHSTRK